MGRGAALWLTVGLFAGCEPGAGRDAAAPLPDGGDATRGPDASPADAADLDAADLDAADLDAADLDAEPLDAAGPDADPADAAVPDALAPDAAPPPEDPSTALDDAGHLFLFGGVPLRAADCDCPDGDADGLADAWEAQALDLLRPLLRFDELEPLVDDPEAVVAMVGRVAPAGEAELRVYLLVGYSRDYGTCLGISAHDGDPERVALRLAVRPDVGPGAAEVIGAFTAAHEGTVGDHSRRYEGGDLAALVFEPDARGPRWVVFPSRGKHGTYATVEACETVSPIPCVDEDCAPDGVDDPARFDRLPPVVNAGEPEAPLLDDLAVVGFPGDSAWADQPFCGGRARENCSATVRGKLLADPFD